MIKEYDCNKKSFLWSALHAQLKPQCAVWICPVVVSFEVYSHSGLSYIQPALFWMTEVNDKHTLRQSSAQQSSASVKGRRVLGSSQPGEIFKVLVNHMLPKSNILR